MGADPAAFIPPFARIRGSHQALRMIRFFASRFILATAGIGALIALIVLLGSGASTSLVNSILGIVAAVGITTASLSAGRLRQDLYIDLIALSITKVPGVPPRHPHPIWAVRNRGFG
jgi:hypothetical protein